MHETTRRLAWLAIGAVTLSCGATGAPSAPKAPQLVLQATPATIRPDGMTTSLRVTVLGDAPARTATVKASCGTLATVVPAASGTALQLAGDSAGVEYSCDASRSACCAGTITVRAELGGLVATRDVVLDPLAPDFVVGGGTIPSGGSGGTIGGGSSGGGTNTPPDAGAFSPDEVLLFGSLWGGSCSDALAHLSSPAKPVVGFDCINTYGNAYLTPSGDVLYKHAVFEPSRIRRLVRDPLRWDATAKWWNYAATPVDDDPEVPSPACASAEGVFAWVVQGGTGDVFYTCTADAFSYVWYDQTGAEKFRGAIVYAWTQSDLKFGTDTQGFWVRGADNVRLPVTGLPDVAVRALRTDPDGFRIVVPQSSADGSLDELWKIAATGVATKVGVYPALANVTLTPQTGKLDAAGNLYQIFVSPSGSHPRFVVKRAVGAAAQEIVFDDANAPAANATNPKANLYVRLDVDRSALVAAP